MNTIDKEVIYEQQINKSRFICYLFPIKNVDEANHFINIIKSKHYDANHNCYAYILGDHATNAKSDDDGEPSRTAGIVIFDVLKKNNLTNVLAIVTRYFGGIKLGAPGLIRAYSSSVAKAIELVNIIRIEKFIKITLQYDYLYNNQIEKLISQYQEIKKEYHQNIYLEIIIPEQDHQELINQLINLTKNNIIITIDQNS